MLYKAGSKLILTGKKLRYKAVLAQISVTVTDVMLFCARMEEVHPLYTVKKWQASPSF